MLSADTPAGNEETGVFYLVKVNATDLHLQSRNIENLSCRVFNSIQS